MWGLSSLGALIGKAGRLSVDEEIRKDEVTDLIATAKPTKKGRLLTTAEILKAYGEPGEPNNLTVITVPYPFRIAWNPAQRTTRVTIHKKVADTFMNVCDDILKHYGVNRISELGIDLFGGCYNHRPQRGTEKKYEAAIKAKNYALAYTYLSRHSWAIAIDLDPNRNQLKWKADRAQFAKPEYKAMNDIFYEHGFIGYGRERNNDWMHYEIGIIHSLSCWLR